MEMKAHDKFVAFLQWSPVDDRLVSAGADGRARVWNSARDNMVLSLPYGFAQAQWSPDGEQIAVGVQPGWLPSSGVDPVDEGLVRARDSRTGQRRFETHADKDEKWGWFWAEYSPDGRYMLSRTMLQWPDTTDANKYYMFDSQSGEIVRKLETGQDVILLLPDWAPDGQHVAGGDFEGTIYFWEVSSGELVNTMSCLARGHIVQWSPDGSKIAMLCFDFNESVNVVQVIDAETHALLLTIEGDVMSDQFQWFRWSPDSTRIAIGGGSDETGQTPIRFTCMR